MRLSPVLGWSTPTDHSGKQNKTSTYLILHRRPELDAETQSGARLTQEIYRWTSGYHGAVLRVTGHSLQSGVPGVGAWRTRPARSAGSRKLA